ncbi:MAG: preprotein translocase subunit YajC [Anaerovoracaceae bacterium]|nr:preprotein translocase subunit YajC [Anaerovoracaceae bacterium]
MQGLASLVPLLVLIVLMYFLMIRPQKKKDKQIQDMRRNLQVGDEIVTIGGICGKIVKTKDETIVIQVGADKVKFEMMRWSVSTVTNASQRVREDVEAAEEEQKKIKPKRLRKSADVDEEPKSDETTVEEIRAEEEKAEK